MGYLFQSFLLKGTSLPNGLLQCDQIARLFAYYLVILNIVNLPQKI